MGNYRSVFKRHKQCGHFHNEYSMVSNADIIPVLASACMPVLIYKPKFKSHFTVCRGKSTKLSLN